MNHGTRRNRISRLLLAVSCGWVALVACPLVAAEPLLWKLAVGQELHYQMGQLMTMGMDMGAAGEMKTDVKQQIDMAWQVESIDEKGDAVIQQQITRIRMTLNAPGQQETKFDTASKEEPQGFAAMAAPMLKGLIATPFQVTMTSQGEITDVEVPEAMVEAVRNSPAGEMMGEFASADGLKSMVQQGLLVLPQGDDLVKGHSWTATNEMEVPNLGKLTLERAYRYEGPRKVDGQNMEVFALAMTMEYGDSAGPDGSTIEVVAQESKGEILFNRDAGCLESSSLRQVMDQRISMAGQVMNQKIDQTVSLKRVDKPEALAPTAE